MQDKSVDPNKVINSLSAKIGAKETYITMLEVRIEEQEASIEALKKEIEELKPKEAE